MPALIRRFVLLSLVLAPFARPVLAQTPPAPGSAPAVAPVAPAAPATPAEPGEDSADDDEKPRHHRHHTGEDRVNVGGSVEVKEGETVGDAVGVGGSVTVAGHVTGDAVAVGGTLHVARTAHLDGDAVAVGGTLDIEDGAVVQGQRISVGPALGVMGLGGLAGALGAVGLAWTIATLVSSILGLIALGALCVAFIPDRLERIKLVLQRRPGPSGGVGLLAFASLIPLTVVLVFTLVGILVVPFLWMFFGLMMLLGLVSVAQVIGERLPLGPQFRGPFATLTVGALMLTVIRFVPILGWLVFVVCLLAGTGAVLLSRAGAPTPHRPEPMPPFGTPDIAPDIAPVMPPPPDEHGPAPL